MGITPNYYGVSPRISYVAQTWAHGTQVLSLSNETNAIESIDQIKVKVWGKIANV